MASMASGAFAPWPLRQPLPAPRGLRAAGAGAGPRATGAAGERRKPLRGDGYLDFGGDGGSHWAGETLVGNVSQQFAKWKIIEIVDLAIINGDLP